MKYSQLDESLIFEAKTVFDQIKVPHSDTEAELRDLRISLYTLTDFHTKELSLPDQESLRLQLKHNLEVVDDVERYLSRLHSWFPRLSELVDALATEKCSYIVEHKDPPPWCLLKPSMILGPEGYVILTEKEREEWKPEPYDVYKRYSFYLEPLNRLIALAETIHETGQFPQTAEKEEAEPERPPIELKRIGQKIVLLHELGIIDHLMKTLKGQDPTFTATTLSKILAPLLGETGKEETIRKGISGYGQGTKDDPKTKTAMDYVKGELLKYGIYL